MNQSNSYVTLCPKLPSGPHVDVTTVPRRGGSERSTRLPPGRCTAMLQTPMGSTHECGDSALVRGNPVNTVMLSRSLRCER